MTGTGTVSNPTSNLNQLHLLKDHIHDIRHKKSSNPLVVQIAGDGSNRKFFRVSGAETPQILMLLPEEEGTQIASQSHPWVLLQKSLQNHGIKTPDIYSQLAHESCLLIEDCGDQTLADRLQKHPEQFDFLYQQAAKICAQINQLSIESPNPDFNYQKFADELFFYYQWAQPEVSQKAFEQDIHHLVSELMELPRGFCHRDFHSRNIMIQDDDMIIIDFQDARYGPLSYDLVSLCFDPYFEASFDKRCKLLQTGSTFYNTPEHIAGWELALIQRLIKAMGSFHYLTHLKRGNYLQYVPKAAALLSNLDLSKWPTLEFIVERESK